MIVPDLVGIFAPAAVGEPPAKIVDGFPAILEIQSVFTHQGESTGSALDDLFRRRGHVSSGRIQDGFVERRFLEGFPELRVQHLPKSLERRFHFVESGNKVVPRIQLGYGLFITSTDLKLPVEKAFEVFRTKHANNHRLFGGSVVESQLGLLGIRKASFHREIERASRKCPGHSESPQ